MKIAIIGGGISGNLVARLLCDAHDVQLFEANAYPGGHTHSHTIRAYGRELTVDTGFMVFNDRTYPNFVRVLDTLGVASQTSDMSFSVRCARTGLEYQGSSLNGLFAQRRNLLRPTFWRMLAEILRFNRTAPQLLHSHDDQLTLGDYLNAEGYSRAFQEHYLIPMGAAIWSSAPRTFYEFPARFLVGFLQNHGLLKITDRPIWKTIRGGARTYVEKLLAPLGDNVRLNTPIASVKRHPDHVIVQPHDGLAEIFDAVVLATHADQSLKLLTDATPAERAILSAFPYQRNEAVLHTDPRWLPRRRRAWASWNYHLPIAKEHSVSVTYELNRLQRLGAPGPVCLTLNPTEEIDPQRVRRRMVYHHPLFGPGAVAAQRRLGEISGVGRTFFCGAYWGYGFHEDGVNSALAVARHFGKSLDTCTVASTKAALPTAV